MSLRRPRVVVIGIGNRWRRDDGVGSAAADLVAPRLGADVVVVHSDGEPGRLIDAWADTDLAIVVDAVRTGAAPGRIHHVQALETMTLGTPQIAGSHALGLVHAVRLAGAVRQLPRQMVVIGIEVDDTTTGQGLSPAVAEALPAVVCSIVAAVDKVRG